MSTATKPFERIQSRVFFKVPLSLLRLLFVTTEEITKNVAELKFSIVFWIFIPIFTTLSFLQVAFIVQLIRNEFELEAFCFAQSVFAYHITCFSKVLLVGWSNSKLKKVFNILNDIHPQTDEEHMEYKIREWWQQTRRIVYQYSAIQLLVVLNYFINSMYDYTKVYLATGVWKMELPVNAWIPFSTDSPLPFYSVYLVSFFVGMSSSICLTACDLLLMSIVQLICAHYNYIQRVLMKMMPERSDPARDMVTIKFCVVRHNTIME